MLGTEPTYRLNDGGKADFQKLLEIFRARGQEFLSDRESSKSKHFNLKKVRLLH